MTGEPRDIAPTVLIVDDEPLVLTVTGFALQKGGYTVLTAENGRDALEVYRRDWRAILAVVLDLTMPEMSGAAVFEKLKEINPGVSVILTSGFTELAVDGRFDPANLVTFLQKPYPIEDLYVALRQVAKPSAG